VPLPRWVGARWNTSGGMSLVLSCTRVLVVGVTSLARERGRERASRRERERERERGSGPCSSSPVPLSCVYSSLLSCVRMLVCSYVCSSFPLSLLFFSFPHGALDTPFYRCKEMPSCIMGCSWELTWLAGKCPEPCTDNNVAVGGGGGVSSPVEVV
jgi:hypothetical protein